MSQGEPLGDAVHVRYDDDVLYLNPQAVPVSFVPIPVQVSNAELVQWSNPTPSPDFVPFPVP